MIVKINCQLLSEQIQFLDMCSDAMTNEHNKGLVDGIANLLSEISFAVEEEDEISFVRYDD